MTQSSLPPPTDAPVATQTSPLPTGPPAVLVESTIAEALKPLQEDLRRVVTAMTDISKINDGLTKSVYELNERIESLEVALKKLDPSARNTGDNDHQYSLFGQLGSGARVNNYESTARSSPPTSTIDANDDPKDTGFDGAVEAIRRKTTRLEEVRRKTRKRLEERAIISNHIGFARSMNRLARDDDARLLPLRLRDGTMPEEIFPQTLGAFKALTGTGTYGGSTGSTISSSMTAEEILPLLIVHGCEDITSQLDTSKVGPVICNGGFGDVHYGALQNKAQLAARELYVWSKCRHRNILKLLGVANYNNQIAMVSPWMTNGDLPRYLSKYPEADRYILCSQVADAVAYLKDNKIVSICVHANLDLALIPLANVKVHGDIKGTNILISEYHVPKLTDFGSSALSKYTTLAFTVGNGTQPVMTLRWTAPEIFIEGTVHTFESDVYALGMTILEAFTGLVPYANLPHQTAVMGRLMQRIHPERPQECLGVPVNRPTAQSIRNTLMDMRPTEDNRVELAASEDSISQLDISKVGPAIYMGGFGNVHCGALKNGDKVAVKYLRMLGANNSDDKQLKLAAREIQVWSKRQHHNILKMLGVAVYNNRIALISPWMANGNLTSYLLKHPEADRYDLVHGDIKGANVLVSEDYVPKLTDFGSSTLSKYTLAFTATQPYMVLRWTAPEIFIEGKAHTFESDVYALGMTILEAFTGSVPYGSLHDLTVMIRLMQKIPPERPRECMSGEFPDALWNLLASSWDVVPKNRPMALSIRSSLVTMMKPTEVDEGKPTAKESNKQPQAEVASRQSSYYPLHNMEFDIHAEVKALKKDVLDVRSYFDDIYNTLDRLERESLFMRLRSWVGATPAGAWDVIRKEYDRLLRESRRLATTVAAGAEDFRTDMIPFLQDTTASFEEKRRKLTKFITDMKETDAYAERISQGFVDIARSIRTFQTRYFSKVEKGKENIDKRIHRLNKEIEELVESIEKYKAKEDDTILKELRGGIPSNQDDVVGDQILTGMAGLSGPVGERSLLPKAFGDTQTTAAATEAQAHLAQAKEELNEKGRALNKLGSDLANLEHLVPSHIKAAGSHTDYICGRLGAIGKMWAVFRVDAQNLHSQLNKAHNAPGEKEFSRMIQERTRIIPLYDKIEKVLYSYSSAVTEW
ncbi:Putative serine/threonine-protein kinase/receptor R826 [Rhizoctonia solani]|uniref:Putative serine/threonine-protein kinase/receptor R826 n=1 Tax=Rhizoctonia solani TaxID=456999 RepID=A0A0K6G503_9AGAM|nr:Putative serine/threonine-protein kinase/receptor R826 [Rhizoctonia solani]